LSRRSISRSTFSRGRALFCAAMSAVSMRVIVTWSGQRSHIHFGPSQVTVYRFKSGRADLVDPSWNKVGWICETRIPSQTRSQIGFSMGGIQTCVLPAGGRLTLHHSDEGLPSSQLSRSRTKAGSRSQMSALSVGVKTKPMGKSRRSIRD
jgi:hypothetical protein